MSDAGPLPAVLPAQGTDERAGVVIAALAFAQLVSWGSIFYGFSLFVVPMERELGWSRTAMNGALSLGLLVSGLCAYPIGRWIDQHGGRAVMTLGSVLAGLLFIVWSYVTTLQAFFLVWIGLGVAMGATFYDPVFAVVTRQYPVTFRTKIIGITLAGGFASTVFIPLTQALVEHLGWRHALLVLGLLNLLICVPIHGFLLRDRVGDAQQDRDLKINGQANTLAVHRALRDPVFWALLLCFTAYYATFTAMTFHLVPLFIERGIATGLIVSAMAVIGPAQVAARVILLAFGKHFNTAVVGRIVMLVFVASIALLIFCRDSTALLFVTLLLYGGANGMITIVRGTAVADLLGREGYGAINGLISFPSNIAKAVGPIGVALVWSMAGSYTASLWCIFAVALLAAICFGLAAGYKR